MKTYRLNGKKLTGFNGLKYLKELKGLLDGGKVEILIKMEEADFKAMSKDLQDLAET